MADIRLIPFVCGAGASTAGCEQGPVAAKAFGLEKDLGAAWQEDPDILLAQEQALYRNLSPLGAADRDAIVLRNCRHVADQVEAAVKDGAMPVTIGGDHTIAAGTVAGFARAKQAHGRIGLVWIDAHPDLHTPDTTHTHALHGMPIAALLGLIDTDFGRIGGDTPVLNPEHLVYAGIRDIEPAEEKRIRDLNIKNFPGAGFSDADFIKAVDDIAAATDYLVVSFDLDSSDPGVAPAVGTPVQNGLQRDRILALLKTIADKHKPDMIEVVEFNPALPGKEQTYALLRDVLRTTLGV
jgi:arginase